MNKVIEINVMKIGNKDVIAYLGLQKKLNNKNFKGVEFTTFENEASTKKIINYHLLFHIYNFLKNI